VKVVLVRHAIAAERDPSKWPDDSLRPLTPEGVERFRRAARGLGRLVSDVDVVLSSRYVRAWRTAELLCTEVGWPVPEECAELEASREPAGAVEALRRHSAAGSIALVGHEPHLSSLASLLLSGDEAGVRLELKKGGAALLEVDDDRTTLVWHVPPRLLRLLA
jgi:phosphohistidine phosphatase